MCIVFQLLHEYVPHHYLFSICHINPYPLVTPFSQKKKWEKLKEREREAHKKMEALICPSCIYDFYHNLKRDTFLAYLWSSRCSCCKDPLAILSSDKKRWAERLKPKKPYCSFVLDINFKV